MRPKAELCMETRGRVNSQLQIYGYHNVRVHPDDEHLTSFNTPFGTYRTRVMQQGDCNAPATFMKLMNHIFKDMIGRNIYVYLDDILIFNETKEEHIAT